MPTKKRLARPAPTAAVTGTRREFLYGAATLVAAPLFGGSAGCAVVQPTTQPGAVPRERGIGIDMHNHVYPAGTEPHAQRGPRPGETAGDHPSQARSSGGARDDGPLGPPEGRGDASRELPSGPDLSLSDELKLSGFTAVAASFVLDFAANTRPGDARDNLLRWFTALDAELEKGHLHRALDMKDLVEARDHGLPTLIQSVEGSHFIEGDLRRIEEVYGRGLRHLQLLHERDDMVSPLGDTNSAVAHLGGLTDFGADVVKTCNQLGIVVDLAHASDTTVRAALKVATQPFIVSHTNLDTWSGGNARMAGMMKPRLIGKDSATRIAKAGGVIGVWTHLTSSLPELAQSIRTMVDAIGVDHVGVGTDTDLLSKRVGQGTNRAYPELTGGLFVALTGELRRQGFSADDIDKIGGGNYCRVFANVTGGRA